MGVKGLTVHFICPNNWVIIVREYIFDHFLLKSLYLVCHFYKWVLYHLLANDEQTSQNYSITVKEEKIDTTLTNLTLWKKISVKQLKLNCELTSQWPEKIFSEFLYTITSVVKFSILLSKVYISFGNDKENFSTIKASGYNYTSSVKRSLNTWLIHCSSYLYDSSYWYDIQGAIYTCTDQPWTWWVKGYYSDGFSRVLLRFNQEHSCINFKSVLINKL